MGAYNSFVSEDDSGLPKREQLGEATRAMGHWPTEAQVEDIQGLSNVLVKSSLDEIPGCFMII